MKILKTLLFLSVIVLIFSECTNTKGKASEPTDNWKLGIQMWTFRVFTFTDAVNKADSAGIRYIEAFGGQPLGGNMRDTFGINMSATSRKYIKKLLLSKNIQIIAMGVIAPKTIDEWYKQFELAKEFNLSYITAEPMKDQWKTIDSIAGVYHIKIAIHDHPRPTPYWHPDSVIAAMRGCVNIGACADVGHWARSGLDPVQCMKKLEGHIYGVHLKDIKTFGQVDAADTVVGKGVVNFDAVFRELKRQNFKGMLSIEHESNWYHNLADVIETKKYYNEQIKAINTGKSATKF